MIGIKEEPTIPTELLWQKVESKIPDTFTDETNKTTLFFAVFYLDEILQDKNDIMIKSYLTELSNLFHPWNSFYPWSNFNGVKLELRCLDDSLSIIFGSLVVENNVREEEAIVVSILLEFSKTVGKNTYIKVLDTNGEFLLAEGHSFVPEELEYPISINRVWIFNGRIRHIPNTFKPNTALKKSDALCFLQDDRNRLETSSSLEEHIRSNFLGDFPSSYLGRLREIRVQISEPNAKKLLLAVPNISTLALFNFFMSSCDCDLRTLEDLESKPQSISILLPTYHLESVKSFVDCELSSGQCENYDDHFYSGALGKILTSSLKHMLQNKEISFPPEVSNSADFHMEVPATFTWNTNKFEIKEINWKEIDKIGTFDDERNPLNELAEELETVLRESVNVHESMEPEQLEDITDSDSISGLSDVSIDEEDFFEFFLTNALNIPQDQLRQFT